ncbi:MAG: zinc ribbon domain-containing protein [Anaerolineae bacterium]|nr:zinc ribbon domain-containing protein [Anaerolineae bacterium]
MPVYTYRREDGTTFDYRQKFLDDPLTVDPETGQHVVRVIQAAGVIFKGSGFYVNDSKSASRSAISPSHKSEDKAESKPEASAAKTESSAPAASPSTASAPTTTVAAAAD